MTGKDNKSTDDITKKTTTKLSNSADDALEVTTTKSAASKTSPTGDKISPNFDKTVTDKSSQTKKTSSSKQATPNKSEVSEPPQKTSILSSIALIIILLLIIGLAVSAFYGLRFWEDYSTQQEQRLLAIESKNNQQLVKINALGQEQVNKNADQADFLNTIKNEQNALQAQINQRLDSHTERLRALAGTSRSDWLLAEARYLLRLASQRLLVENSTVAAQALLQSADDILLSIDDAELLPARSAIAAEMIALRLAKAVDRPGIYLQLSALKDEIQALPEFHL